MATFAGKHNEPGTSGINEATNKLFDSGVPQFLAGPLNVVVCYASWCGPCTAMRNHLKQLSSDRELMGKVTFHTLNVDHHPKTAKQLKVKAVPFTIIYEGLQQVDQIVGAVGIKEQILAHWERVRAAQQKNPASTPQNAAELDGNARKPIPVWRGVLSRLGLR